jgi:hypothetical protein
LVVENVVVTIIFITVVSSSARVPGHAVHWWWWAIPWLVTSPIATITPFRCWWVNWGVAIAVGWQWQLTVSWSLRWPFPAWRRRLRCRLARFIHFLFKHLAHQFTLPKVFDCTLNTYRTLAKIIRVCPFAIDGPLFLMILRFSIRALPAFFAGCVVQVVGVGCLTMRTV